MIWWTDLSQFRLWSVYQRGGLSWAVLLFAWTGDQHQPQVRQGPHPLRRLHTAEGPLQRDNQVIPKDCLHSETVFYVIFFRVILKTEPTPSDSTGKKMCVRQKKTRCVWMHVFNQTISFFPSAAPVYYCLLVKLRWHAQHKAFVFIVTGGDVQKFQTWWHRLGKSGILHLLLGQRQINTFL